MLTDERKKEIRELADAATGPAWEIREVAHEETPWRKRRVYRVEINAPQYTYGRRTHSRHIAQIVDYAEWTDHPANAKFVAESRTAVPELLDHIEELECAKAFQDQELVEKQKYIFLQLERTLGIANRLREHAEAMAEALERFAKEEPPSASLAGCPYLSAAETLDAYRKEYPKE